MYLSLNNEQILTLYVHLIISRERLSCVQIFFFFSKFLSSSISLLSSFNTSLINFLSLSCPVLSSVIVSNIPSKELIKNQHHYSRNLDRTEKTSQTSPNQCKCNISQFHQFKYHYCHVHKLFKTK